MLYSFKFNGEIQDSASPDVVALKLAKLFQVEPNEIVSILDGSAFFERRDIAHATARAYKQEFQGIGAIGHVEKSGDFQEAVAVPKSNFDLRSQAEQSSAPIVAGVDKRNNIEQVADTVDGVGDISKQRIGVSREKSRQTLKAKATARAGLWLRYAGMAIVGTTIADGYLQDALIVDQLGMDIGYWPFILAHIPLIIGCGLLAKVKGYSPYLGLLGVLSLVGLSLLMLMSDKDDLRRRIGLKEVIFTAFSVGIALYWFSALTGSLNERDELISRSDKLHLDRSEYPGPVQGGLDVYKAEQAEMNAYILETFALIEKDELRPDAVEQLAEKMFMEFSRYVAWRKYQEFKHLVSGKELPEGLSKEFTKNDKVMFRGLLTLGINQGSHSRLTEVRNLWFISASDLYSTISDAESFGKSLERLSDIARQVYFGKSRDGVADDSIEVLVSELDEYQYPGVKSKVFEDWVEYTWQQGPYAGKPLAIGLYTSTVVSKSGKKTNSLPKLMVLNHEFPLKYVSKYFGVFDGYAY